MLHKMHTMFWMQEHFYHQCHLFSYFCVVSYCTSWKLTLTARTQQEEKEKVSQHLLLGLVSFTPMPEFNPALTQSKIYIWNNATPY